MQLGALQHEAETLMRLALHEETAQPQPWAAGKERGGPAGMTGRGAQAGHGKAPEVASRSGMRLQSGKIT
ncbi:hypothetical protein HJA_10705 [Hyphomonas jannaschiana VP2]|uniref:Uncharacterized protein n=1 Tax=Hyphomonas jannaschiana VP2 TaxID=1280952 RepID=A0A059FBY5_9PROT|nr:hypothetical protein HJA_10705 [Hyphomonas jannaschiana VP2]